MVRVRSLVFALIVGLCLTVVGSAAAAPGQKRSGKRAPAFPKYSKSFQARYHVSAKSDPDNDGLNSYNEFLARTNPLRDDTDKDGVDDGREDADKDGLKNAIEQAVGSSPARRDTNRNRRSDGSEDRDRDGLSNLAEQRTGNDPRDEDTDNDGVLDGDENVGRVVRFDRETGELRLWLASERRVISATLGEDASVVCPAMTVDDEPSDEPADEPADEGEYGSDDLSLSVEQAFADDPDSAPDSGDDAAYDQPSIEDGEPADSGTDGIADDRSMCLDSIKRGVWFANAEFYEDDDSGALTVAVLELTFN